MKRLEPPSTPEAKAAVDASLRYQEALRHYAVWEYDDPLHIGYPRFVAVIEDKKVFEHFRKKREPIRKALEQHERPTRWLPTFCDETWQRATLSINTAYSSRLLSENPDVVELTPVPPERWSEREKALKPLLPKIRKLPGVRDVKLEGREGVNPFGYRIFTPTFIVRSKKGSVSYRRYSGRAFRLRGLTTKFEERPHHKLGILVLRGLEGDIEIVDRERKQRSDTKTERVLLEESYELVSK
jgi:hypothetical protein